MDPNDERAPLLITVKVSKSRFVVAKRYDVSYDAKLRRPIGRYEAVSQRLTFRDANEALAVAVQHGVGAVAKQSKPLSRQRSPAKSVVIEDGVAAGNTEEPKPTARRLKNDYAVEYD